MSSRLVRVVMFAVALAGMGPSIASAQAAAPVAVQRRTISTTGEATVRVVPDEVVVHVGVETHAATLPEAKGQSDAAARAMLKAVRDLGVGDRQIQADNIRVTIRYDDRNRDEPLKVVGYTVRRDYAVTLTDIAKLEAVLDAALNNGANVLEGVDYRTTRLRELRDQARALAAKAAREKAEALAGTLGAGVGVPLTIGEGGVGYLAGWPRRDRGNAMMQNTVVSVGGDAAAAGETVPLGQIGIVASVSVVFELTDAPPAPPARD